MPILVRKIEGEINSESISNIQGISLIEGQIGLEDYAKVYDYTAYLQNFTKVTESEVLNTTKYYGVIGNINNVFTEIEISY